jgi:hypothetical protein
VFIKIPQQQNSFLLSILLRLTQHFAHACSALLSITQHYSALILNITQHYSTLLSINGQEKRDRKMVLSIPSDDHWLAHNVRGTIIDHH